MGCLAVARTAGQWLASAEPVATRAAGGHIGLSVVELGAELGAGLALALVRREVRELERRYVRRSRRWRPLGSERASPPHRRSRAHAALRPCGRELVHSKCSALARC